MFPITEQYLDHIHTRNNNPVPVKYSIQTEITTKMKRILQLHARGKKIVFPDISRLESLMLEEIWLYVTFINKHFTFVVNYCFLLAAGICRDKFETTFLSVFFHFQTSGFPIAPGFLLWYNKLILLLAVWLKERMAEWIFRYWIWREPGRNIPQLS